ncbi:MAG TPA: RNA methyltransferase [Thermoanaerobaculia bacterium]|nr:RNA methyltransferase [Thermoanaerobaculia bacterium]
MARLRVVLVEPQEAGNVGAAARVMKNFGFEELYVAGSHPELFPVAGWWASGADDLLQRIVFTPTLHEAIADAHLTIATTSSRGRTRPAGLTPSEVGRELATLAGGETLALVFGREDSGLTREELMLCGRTASIPTSESFPTMNLAQSVGVFAWELSSVERREAERDLAPAAHVERLHERLESLLLEAGFLHPDNPDRIYDDVRAMLGRARLDAREVTILLGIIRQLEWWGGGKSSGSSEGSR